MRGMFSALLRPPLVWFAAAETVPAAIAGIYGMNFSHMPELNWTFGYPAAIASMLLLTIGLYTWFKRRDWL